ncbi:MAG: DEAD/DEAH box helicase [Planctomycetota bacterium]|nr:DEAD/DEAH box helicase [Planctomycetota bacterium]
MEIFQSAPSQLSSEPIHNSTDLPEDTPAEVLDHVPQFRDLGLSPELLEAVDDVGYIAPSPIQAAFIPIAIKGGDCIGQARTGTGKTAAFVLPILQQINRRAQDVQALIMSPTRELSEQVAGEFDRLSQTTTPCRCTVVVGGRPIKKQMSDLRKGSPVVVGTPGRLIDLISRKAIDLGHLKFVVLDEADRMLDIGFRPDIERILRRCPTERQTLLLSATMEPAVERLARRYMHDPVRIDTSSNSVVVDTIEQFYITVDQHRKPALLAKLLLQERPAQALVFTRTKRGADRLHQTFSRKLRGVEAIHGDLQQSQRDRVMKDFRSGECRLLIATDVVGRGIDISGISHIINYDIPQDCDDYVHRIGRTGRMASEHAGRAITFVAPDEGSFLTQIEIRINQLLPPYAVKGFVAFDAKSHHAHKAGDGKKPSDETKVSKEPEPEVEEEFGFGFDLD